MAGNPNFYFAHRRKKEELQKKINDLEQENEELRQQLEASQKLAEERRVALVKCSPFGWNTSGTDKCYFCKAKITDTHKPNCDYIRLIEKED